MLIALLWFLLGYFYLALLLVGQALVLLLGERERPGKKVLRSLAYWTAVAALLWLASTHETLARFVLLPLMMAILAPLELLQGWWSAAPGS
jgi:low temperature requirement protein LtrA